MYPPKIRIKKRAVHPEIRGKPKQIFRGVEKITAPQIKFCPYCCFCVQNKDLLRHKNRTRLFRNPLKHFQNNCRVLRKKYPLQGKSRKNPKKRVISAAALVFHFAIRKAHCKKNIRRRQLSSEMQNTCGGQLNRTIYKTQYVIPMPKLK